MKRVLPRVSQGFNMTSRASLGDLVDLERYPLTDDQPFAPVVHQ
jgi:hypothetical protein